MQCISCRAEIPPAWVACIQANSCPGCGGPIMDEGIKGLMDELRQAMEQMPKADAESIVGWLLSNYRLEKIGSGEPTEFHRKNYGPAVGEDGQPIKMANSKIQEFYKNAGVDMSKKKRLSQVMNDLNSDLPEEDLSVDPEPGEQDVLMKDYLANNSVFSNEPGQHLSPKELGNMMELVSQAKSENSGSQALNAERMERLRKQKDLVAMGSVGKVSRSGG